MTTEWTQATDASAAQDAAREDRSKPYEDVFFVELTDAERVELLAESASLLSQIEGAEESKRQVAKAAQEAIDSKYERLHEIGRIATRGTVERAIKVVDVRVFATNEMRIERVDTGEVVFRRALSSDERQGDLFEQGIAETGNGATAATSTDAGAEPSTTDPPHGAEPVAKGTAGSEVMADTSASAGEESTAPEGATPDAFGGVHDPTEADRGDPITAAAENLGTQLAKDVVASLTKPKRKRSKKNGAAEA
jgi:hypothetical protein